MTSYSRIRKKQRELGMSQNELPGVNSQLIDQGRSRKKPNWYYITGGIGDFMIAEFDKHGSPIWVEHDLRTSKPHLYNSIHKANHDKAVYNGWEVKLYPFYAGK